MYDPWVTREFQIRDLMAQHSGLAPYSGDYQSFLGFDRQHIIHSLRYLPPVTSFRSQFAYQNNLFLVVAALVEKYTGLSWEQNLERRIFRPLGMNDSSAGLEAFKATTNLALPHTRQNDKIIPLGKDWPFQGGVYIYGPAGGINSNVLDMAKWLRFHLGKGTFEGKQLVSRENLVFTHSPRTIIAAGEMAGQLGKVHPLLGDGAFYAQGWLYVYEQPYSIVWHNGGTVGCKSVVVFVPDAQLGIVVLSNLGETPVPEILAQWFLDRYFRTGDTDWNQIALDDRKNQKPTTTQTPAVVTPALSLSAYRGIYTNNIYGEAIVSEEAGNLVVMMGPARVKGRLTYRTDNSFLLQVKEDYGDDSNLTFTTRSGRAESFSIDALNTDGSGVFRRRY
jgi:CubicO group peptidase (beta-lactamase class C family)